MDGATFSLRTLGSCALIQRDGQDGVELRTLAPRKPLSLLAYAAANAVNHPPAHKRLYRLSGDTRPHPSPQHNPPDSNRGRRAANLPRAPPAGANSGPEELLAMP